MYINPFILPRIGLDKIHVCRVCQDDEYKKLYRFTDDPKSTPYRDGVHKGRRFRLIKSNRLVIIGSLPKIAFNNKLHTIDHSNFEEAFKSLVRPFGSEDLGLYTVTYLEACIFIPVRCNPKEYLNQFFGESFDGRVNEFQDHGNGKYFGNGSYILVIYIPNYLDHEQEEFIKLEMRYKRDGLKKLSKKFSENNDHGKDPSGFMASYLLKQDMYRILMEDLYKCYEKLEKRIGLAQAILNNDLVVKNIYSEGGFIKHKNKFQRTSSQYKMDTNHFLKTLNKESFQLHKNKHNEYPNPLMKELEYHLNRARNYEQVF